MLFKQIHLASKDLNKALKEHNIIPFFTYIFFFITFSVIFSIKYICKLYKQVFKTTTIIYKTDKK